MFALGLFIGFITGVVSLAVVACIFVENEEKIAQNGFIEYA